MLGTDLGSIDMVLVLQVFRMKEHELMVAFTEILKERLGG